ncbi:MAG TPA: putative metal-dependent hydrolase [Vicinamibacterales bacterium]
MADLDTLRYPVGKFERPVAPLDRATRDALVKTIEDTPARMRALVEKLSDRQLETPYRPGGWSIRQVVHHVPDSHLNAYVRMKLAMTEDTPTIRTYEEQRWAELPEAKSGDVSMSLSLLEALHRRWVVFLRNLSDADFSRAYLHPDMGRMRLDEVLALYGWHCHHHVAHIEQALRA